MSALPATRARLGIGLVSLCAALLMTACTTGQQAQTSHEVPAIDATSGAIGAIQLRNVSIRTPPQPSYSSGAEAALQLVIVNTGHGADALSGVSSPATSGYRVFTTAAEADAAASPSGSGSASASGSGSPSSSPSSNASASPPASAAPQAPLDIPAGVSRSLSILDTDAVLVITLTKTLFTGATIPITFTFADAGSVTLAVPVQISDNASRPGITITPPSSDAAG